MEREDLKSGNGSPITAEQFLADFRKGVERTHFIALRGKQIPVRILTLDDMNKIRRESLVSQAKVSGDDTDRNIWVQKQTLAMATKIEEGKPPFLHEKILGAMTIDEVEYIYNEYLKVMARFNPALEELSEPQFRALVEAAKKKSVSWSDLSLPQMRVIFEDWQSIQSQRAEAETQQASTSGGQPSA